MLQHFQEPVQQPPWPVPTRGYTFFISKIWCEIVIARHTEWRDHVHTQELERAFAEFNKASHNLYKTIEPMELQPSSRINWERVQGYKMFLQRLARLESCYNDYTDVHGKDSEKWKDFNLGSKAFLFETNLRHFNRATARQWNFRALLAPHSKMCHWDWPPIKRDGNYVTFPPHIPQDMPITRDPLIELHDFDRRENLDVNESWILGDVEVYSPKIHSSKNKNVER